jgi:glucose-1-phosphate adenylyltransferase
MSDVLALILGGGRGERLYPLTKYRAKPALPLSGKYRLIDIPVSNCINSGVLRIYVLTQFNSASLNRHIAETYRFSPFMKGFVDVLAAQQTPTSPDWFQGTADAVRKTLWVIAPWSVDDYLILSGDHLYRMDYRAFLRHHQATNADVTLSVIPVPESKASSFGLMKIDDAGRITDFREKPIGAALAEMKVDTQRLGLDAAEAERLPYAGSMGIYVFKRDVLLDLLHCNPQHDDFGKDVIPTAITHYNVQAYLFKGYWEDIGTVESFYHANIELVRQPKPSFSFFDQEFPIYTHARFLPPSKILSTKVEESMICDGTIVKSAEISSSIIGIRSRIEENTRIENTLVMGADYYQTESDRGSDIASGIVPVGIGPNSHIRNAIIDKNARIGKNVKIVNAANVQGAEQEDKGYWIRSGIVVVLKGGVIPDNTTI